MVSSIRDIQFARTCLQTFEVSVTLPNRRLRARSQSITLLTGEGTFKLIVLSAVSGCFSLTSELLKLGNSLEYLQAVPCLDGVPCHKIQALIPGTISASDARLRGRYAYGLRDGRSHFSRRIDPLTLLTQEYPIMAYAEDRVRGIPQDGRINDPELRMNG